MAWWQIALILGGAIVFGVAAGYTVNHRLMPVIVNGIRDLRKAPAPRRAADPSPPVARTVQVPMPKTPEAQPAVPGLFAEVEYNRRIASGDWNGELRSFQMDAWDNLEDEVRSLSVEVRNELTEAYSDMSLANSITWLSTEMARRSPNLDESYLRLRTNIADRLNRIRLMLTHPVGVTDSVSRTRTTAL